MNNFSNTNFVTSKPCKMFYYDIVLMYKDLRNKIILADEIV